MLNSKTKHCAYQILLTLTIWVGYLFFIGWIASFIDVVFFKNSKDTFILIGSIQTTQAFAAFKYVVLSIFTHLTIKDLKALSKKLS